MAQCFLHIRRPVISVLPIYDLATLLTHAQSHQTSCINAQLCTQQLLVTYHADCCYLV